ncbi:MAG: hypothetical protein LC732_03060, partial [Acidobacteria bacterium]|nr:hypothetical protein [Acidobacteriota bacterium]
LVGIWCSTTEVEWTGVANEADDLLKRLLDEVLEGRRALGEGIEGVGNRLDSFRNETLSNFDGVFLRLENVESEIQAVSAALARLERAAEEDRPRRESLRLEIERLKQRLATLERWLADHEGESTEPH